MSIETSVEQTLIDPVRSSLELPYSAELYPLGFPFRVESNSPAVIRAARESWEQFPQRFDKPPVRLSLGVEGRGGELPGPPVFLSRQHLMSIVSDAQNSVVCDMTQGFSFGWVTEEVAAARPFLRYYFLDAALYVMIGQLYLTPIHGALIERDGCGILLTGDSFAGKSTLSYACARAGWTLISDDGTFLVRARADRYGIGNPFAIRFREDARLLFPELASHLTGVRPNGKVAIEVATRDLPEIATALGSTIDHVVYLNRHATGTSRLSPVSRSQALESFEGMPYFGLDSVREECREAYRRLLNGDVWQLDYSDLGSAIERLEALARGGN